MTPPKQPCTICQKKSHWVIHGGRFQEAGVHFACNTHLVQAINWILTHPSKVRMVEVRTIEEWNK